MHILGGNYKRTLLRQIAIPGMLWAIELGESESISDYVSKYFIIWSEGEEIPQYFFSIPEFNKDYDVDMATSFKDHYEEANNKATLEHFMKEVYPREGHYYFRDYSPDSEFDLLLHEH